jgi:hypothetical protein
LAVGPFLRTHETPRSFVPQPIALSSEMMIGASFIVLLFACNGMVASAWQHLHMSAVLPTTTTTSSASRRVSPPRTKAELKEEFFTNDNGLVKFGSLQVSQQRACYGSFFVSDHAHTACVLAFQTVEASIPGASAESLRSYLHTDPTRIIYACWDRKNLEKLDDGLFRIFLKDQKVPVLTHAYHGTCCQCAHSYCLTLLVLRATVVYTAVYISCTQLVTTAAVSSHICLHHIHVYISCL